MFSIQRQITPSALLTISFAGNQGHHLLVLVPTNPGNAALCLSLPGCGPFGEGNTYTSGSGAVFVGTRNLQGDLGSDYGS